MLDTAVELETPEGVGIELRAAGIVVRGLALIVDECIRWGIIFGINVPLALMGGFGMGLMLLSAFAIYWLYGVGFELLRQGQTPGKRMQGIRVVHDDGTPIGFNASVLRNLLLVVDYLPAFYTLGVISMSLSRDFRRLGDLAGGTLVVYVDSRAAVAVTGTEDSPVRMPPVALSVAEQRAVIDFADRQGRLSEDRRRELADILRPLLNCPAEDCVRELDRIARGLKGAGS